MNTRVLWGLPLALACASCQAPDPKVECARLAADLEVAAANGPRPTVALDPYERQQWYLDQYGFVQELRSLVLPYGRRLKTADPVAFCESLTGKSVRPYGLPNPFRK
jgi:hypothetical protein